MGKCMTSFFCLPCNCFNFAAYCTCNLSSVCDYVKKKQHLLVFACFWGFAFSSVQVKHQTYDNSKEKKLPVQTYFLMLSCLDFFSLVIDMAAVFLDGGPIFKGVREDLACEWLDLEDDATLTISECWWSVTNDNPLKYTKNAHGPRRFR